MSLLIHAELHGLAGSVPELRVVLREHAERLAAAGGGLGAAAYELFSADPGEFVLDAWWRDEAALQAHYATGEYAHYVAQVSALLARPSDVTVHVIQRSYRATADLSADPSRQG